MFTGLYFVPEPVAIILGNALHKTEGYENKTFLVYDFGGGALEVSILKVNLDGELEILVSKQNPFLGKLSC